jgi:hypothetical protein
MFWVIFRNPEFILAGYFGYVGLVLIPVFFFPLFLAGGGKNEHNSQNIDSSMTKHQFVGELFVFFVL